MRKDGKYREQAASVCFKSARELLVCPRLSIFLPEAEKQVTLPKLSSSCALSSKVRLVRSSAMAQTTA